MTFFNKKEDVINIELTPYGRSLIATGKFIPEYYAFFDDDVLYDAVAGGFSEEQNVIKTRIISETPRLKPQRCLQSPEKIISEYERTEEDNRPHTTVKMNYLTEPMGTSEQSSDFGPSWDSLFIQGEITGSVDTVLTGSSIYLKQIPQINAAIEYSMDIRNTADDSQVGGPLASSRSPLGPIYPDGTYLNIEENQILCQLLEKNSFLYKDGLEIEVFMYDDTSENNIIPLKFAPRQNMVKDDILLEDAGEFLVDLNPTYVEYYINLKVDSQIPTDDLCKGIRKLQSKDIELDMDVECPDLETTNYDIYGSRFSSIQPAQKRCEDE